MLYQIIIPCTAKICYNIKETLLEIGFIEKMRPTWAINEAPRILFH